MIDAVLEIGRRFNLRNWVLFATRDETVAAFARNRAELAAFFRVTTPKWDVVKWAWDKSNTYELAERLGVPCPKTFHVQTAEDLPSLYSRLPLAIKPAVKETFSYATGAKAWRANTPGEQHRMFAEALKQIPAEQILLQEIIPGDGSSQFSCCVFFRDGAAHSTLVARRARQYPREFGRAATYVETIALPEIEELSQRLLKSINFYGLAEPEFKQDPRDGKYKFAGHQRQDLGASQSWLGGRRGLSLPPIRRPTRVTSSEPCRGRPGVGWIRWFTGFPVALSELLQGQISAKSYLTSLRRTGIEVSICPRRSYADDGRNRNAAVPDSEEVFLIESPEISTVEVFQSFITGVSTFSGYWRRLGSVCLYSGECSKELPGAQSLKTVILGIALLSVFILLKYLHLMAFKSLGINARRGASIA
jgi:hypothetical protein